MTTAYTSLLGLALPVPGELTGTWGSVVNNSITSLLDTAIAGVATASVTSGDWTLSDIDGASSDARAAIIRPTGSPGVSRNIIAPSRSKAYIIQNESNGPVVIKGSATTGVTIAAGKTTLVAWNGTDFIEIVPSLSTTATAANGLNSATTTVAVSSATAPTTGQVLTATSGSAATWQTPTASGGSVTSVAATVPSFLSVSGSPITTSGTLAISYSGTALPVLNGGTGVTTSTGSGNNVLSTSPTLVTPILGTPTSGTLTSCTGLPLTTGVTGTLPVANGGTGTTTPSLVAGTNVTISGTWPNQTINSTGGGGGGGTVTSVSGTGSVNGITLSGTVTSTGSLTLSGTLSNVSLSSQVTGTLPVANGGTGVTTSTGSGNNVLSTSPTLVTPILGTPTSGTLTSCTGLPLTTGVTGTLPVANGGTGVTSPGTSGNVLTSNGSAWVSSAPSGGSLTGSTTSVKTVLGSGATSGSGDNNVMLGIDVGSSSSTGTFNVAIGKSTALGFTSGVANVAVGPFAMSTAGCSGSSNTAIGAYALSTVTSGSGNIGIGALTGSSSLLPVFNVTTESNRIVMGSSGVTNAYVQVAWTVVSDARDKTNFAPVPHGLNFVEQLNPIAYQFKTSRQDDTPTGIIRYGFKAQDILALEGENSVVIDAEDSEKLRINSDSLVPILVNAIKELSARVAALEASNG